ncbi:MAG: DinB family protein [Chitinophagaceae bacterium]|nr:DinB family protein [Chitinophagaceae bacterium]
MSMIKMLLKEMDAEAITTHKMLQRIPDDKYDWKPHEKSMTISQLATHIAELPTWVAMALTTDGLDFATTPYNPVKIYNTKDLMAFFEKSLQEGRSELEKATDDQLEGRWVLRNGDEIYADNTKGETIRMSFSQIVHHRAQMGVFLRLLNIPIPGSYGPSADELKF